MLAALTKFFTSLKEFVPMSMICWREGYKRETIITDIFSGFTVGLIALPLAIAFAIGSGVTPERGLYTAIFAGFIISLLGGSRVQIGGPTGAFVIIIYDVVQRHGYEGLAVATVLAGIMMVLMGIARFGVFLKFIPYPVTVGFTTGIALVIFSSQIKDFFGLGIGQVPLEFLDRWIEYGKAASTWSSWSFSIGAGTLALIFILRKLNPKFPGVILAVVLATAITAIFGLPIETIHSKFGSIPDKLPTPGFPMFSFDQMQAVFPDAISIALLGAIESLLSAVVADGMTGHKHRSNTELIAQGLANIGSIIFGGIPATGAIARTTANIKLGAKTPLAGMVHSVTLLLLMLLLAPWAAKVPLAALAAVLIYVAWNMSELEHFFALFKGPKMDILVLLTSFLLTVFIDLTVAVQVGVLLAAMLFVKRMSDATTVKICQILLNENANELPAAKDSDIIFRKDVPEDTAVFEIDGPFFFAVSDLLNEELKQLVNTPKIFILRMRKVSAMDATGIHALKQFAAKCKQNNILFLLSGVKEPLQMLLKRSEVEHDVGAEHIFGHLEEALAYARNLSSQTLGKNLAKPIPG